MNVILEDILYAMDFLDEKGGAYYNKKNGDVISLVYRELVAAKTKVPVDTFPEWQQGAVEIAYDIVENNDDYIELPEKDEFDDLAVLKSYVNTLENDLKAEINKELETNTDISKIRSKFDTVLGSNEWFDFKDNFFIELAKSWCIKNNIGFK
ncbi:hypothetical protein SAMN02745163_01173 [Clostridium cavendishii DSM 21758]|uniref:Uncharacterized protein n=1 Tax=Clostridium cavendishii DSM 21758 TaxID=1121302 RepID=A0A1M6FLK8_9CLOT|nr:hypothetical protein [Clostridium cavendishii]SHI98577.1 hypothetical protein SAMN02745163_01173 [Clostridium cavendishii DSM 21758]